MLVVQIVIEKIGKFNGENVTRYLEVYEYEMTTRGAIGVQMVRTSIGYVHLMSEQG